MTSATASIRTLFDVPFISTRKIAILFCSVHTRSVACSQQPSLTVENRSNLYRYRVPYNRNVPTQITLSDKIFEVWKVKFLLDGGNFHVIQILMIVYRRGIGTLQYGPVGILDIIPGLQLIPQIKQYTNRANKHADNPRQECCDHRNVFRCACRPPNKSIVAHLSTSPNTMSIVPMIAATSASWCPLAIQSMDARCGYPGALIFAR